MEVNIDITKTEIDFNKIKIGEVFQIGDNFYIKVDKDKDYDVFKESLTYICSNVLVTPRRAILNIE